MWGCVLGLGSSRALLAEVSLGKNREAAVFCEGQPKVMVGPGHREPERAVTTQVWHLLPSADGSSGASLGRVLSAAPQGLPRHCSGRPSPSWPQAVAAGPRPRCLCPVDADGQRCG